MEVVGEGIGKKTQFLFVTFSFHDFVPVQNFKAISSATPRLLNLNQDQPSECALVFVQIEIMITILIGMLT